MRQSDSIVAIHYHGGQSDLEAALLIDNLHRFTGRFKYLINWVYNLGDQEKQAGFLKTENLQFNPMIPEEIRQFPFASKIFAAVEAEELAVRSNSPLLIWLDEDNLFIHEPMELILQKDEAVALPPVHLQNICSIFDQPIDGYWDTVYSRCGVLQDRIFPMTSFVDQVKIRPHFNAGLIAVNPGRGIFHQWKENFLALYQDPQIESFYEKDSRYRLYIHQASLAGTILAKCERQEIKVLPPTYNFPLHLVKKMDQTRIPANLNQLVSVRYDDLAETSLLSTIPAEEPLKSWLIEISKKYELK